MSDALPDQDQRSFEPRPVGRGALDAPDGATNQGDDSKRLANAELVRLITEGRKFLPARPSTQDVLDRLDTFQSAIEAKLGELEQSIRMPTPVPASARRSVGQLLPWIVGTAIVASGVTLALAQFIR